ELALQKLRLASECCCSALPVSDLEVSRFDRIAMDARIADHRAHILHGAQRLPEYTSCGLAAVNINQSAEAVASDCSTREAAVSPAAAPARAIGFEHCRVN